MYDAVMAIKGGYEPYAAAISVPRGADVRAAVATEAYRTARERVAPMLPFAPTMASTTS